MCAGNSNTSIFGESRGRGSLQTYIYFYIYVYVSVHVCMGILGFMYFALWFRLCFVNKWPYIEREQ